MPCRTSECRDFQTKDVKAGTPLFSYGILGEWHEGNEYCCQSLLTVHRLFFKAPALSFRSLEGGEESLLPDLDVEFYSLACMLKKIWLYLSFLEDLHSTLTYSPDCETEKHDYTARSFPLGRNNDVQRKGSICFEGNLLCSFPALYV